MRTLAIDLETYSPVDIRSCGLYKYAENSEILLFAYAYDDEPVQVVDLICGDVLPDTVRRDITNPLVQKAAFNAAFEMHILRQCFGLAIDPAQWFCTMVQSYTLGLPGSLKDVGTVLGLPEDKQKLSTGRRLIQYFCKPCKPTKANGGRTRNYPSDAPDKWQLFKTYNKQDVEAERAIRHKIEWAYPTETERKLWCLDQKINDNGVLIDNTLVSQAITLDERIRTDTLQKASTLTGMSNPNSNAQLLDWFEQQEGYRPATLDKKVRAELLKDNTISKDTRQMLQYKQLLAKTSVKKYTAMLNAECRDGRVHGMLQFCGAARTGRWAGRLIQFQNLPQNHLDDLDDARNFVKAGDLDSLTLFYDNPSDVLSQLIRTAFVAGDGKRFIVADFAAIEARVIAWYADEAWRQQAFADGKDIYCASASQMFGVPVVKHGINGELRQKGKVAELACIATGQQVLTNNGLKTIETVTQQDLVWDGQGFVQHEGVMFKGYKEVITYEGLTATPDHLVFIEGKSRPIQFAEAAASGAHLVQAGDSRHPIRPCGNHFSRKTMEPAMEPLLCANKMPKLRSYSMAGVRKPSNRKIQRVPILLAAASNTVMVRPKAYSCKTTLRKSKRQGLSQLWRKGDSVYLRECNSCRPIFNAAISSSRSRTSAGPNQQRRRLRPGKCTANNKTAKQLEQTNYSTFTLGSRTMAIQLQCSYTQVEPGVYSGGDYSRCEKSCTRKAKELAGYQGKAPVYDIINAGPNHRFTVSNVLVHNCGYGGGVGALKAFGADKMGMTEEHMLEVIQKWRQASPNIVAMWGQVEKAARTAVQMKGQAVQYKKGLSFYTKKGLLFIRLPSGRAIAYVKPRITINPKSRRSTLAYDGNTLSGSWGTNYTWGGKLVENIVQATARDCLAVAMLRLDAAGYKIVMHVHDEAIMEMPNGQGSLEEAAAIMGQAIPWAPGLLLRADGYETPYYKKD